MQLNIIGNMFIMKNVLNLISPDMSMLTFSMNNKGSFYGISKLASEKIIEEYMKKHDLTFTILRYGSVYSEKSYENNYIYGIIKSAVLDGVINHKGDGNEIKSIFMHQMLQNFPLMSLNRFGTKIFTLFLLEMNVCDDPICLI